MKKSILLGLVALLVAFIISCKDEDKVTDGKLNFTATYGSQPLLMFQPYDYPGVSSVRFQRFSFFISDVALIRSGGGEDISLSEVEYVDFSEIQDETSAAQGISFDLDKIPEGTYEGIRFTVGVSPKLNKTSPADYPTTHPLSKEYWETWGSYISMKIEGNADTLGNGTHNVGLTYHLADTTATTNYVVEIKQPITFTSSETTIPVTVDLQQVMMNGSTAFNILSKPRDHGSDPVISPLFLGNLKASLHYKK